MEKKKVSVNINGLPYTLMGECSESYYLRLGHYVDKSVKDILRTYKNMSDRDAAIMAALTIADELLRLKDENDAMGSKVQKALESELSDQPSSVVSNKPAQTHSQAAKDSFIPRKNN